MNRKILLATLGTAVLSTVILTQPKNHGRIEKHLPWTKNGQQHRSTQMYQSIVNTAIDDLGTKENYGAVIGGSWCHPCTILKKRIDEQNLSTPTSISLEGNNLHQDLQYLNHQLSTINIPSVYAFPTLITNNSGQIEIYKGLTERGMFNTAGEEVPLEEILGKKE